jgi:hypothetical protein
MTLIPKGCKIIVKMQSNFMPKLLIGLQFSDKKKGTVDDRFVQWFLAEKNGMVEYQCM